ncbi:MAG: AIR synthase related protein [Cyanobium sp.]
MQQLIAAEFSCLYGEPAPVLHDAARLELPHSRLAITTDGYVVQPLEFPGGDIGSLAVTGAANDLAMAGAQPLHLSVGLILEEGWSWRCCGAWWPRWPRRPASRG